MQKIWNSLKKPLNGRQCMNKIITLTVTAIAMGMLLGFAIGRHTSKAELKETNALLKHQCEQTIKWTSRYINLAEEVIAKEKASKETAL